jgi:hypothetical protein
MPKEEVKPTEGTTTTVPGTETKPEAATPPPEKTPEEIQKEGDDFLSAFNYAPPVKPEKKPKEEKKETPAEVHPATETPKTETPPAAETVPPKEEDETPNGLLPKPGPKKGKKDETPAAATPPPTPIDEDDLAERTANRVIEKQQAAAEQELETLDPEDAAVLNAVRFMQGDPRFKGKDLEKETKTFWKKEADYQAKWETDHPDEEFNPDAREHAAFYKANALSYSDKDLAQAEKQVEKEQLKAELRQEVRQEYEPEVNTLRYEREYAKVRSQIKKVEDEAVAELVVAAVPEFKAILMDGDKVKTVDQATYDKMLATDPYATELLTAEANDLRVRIEEAEKLSKLGKYYPSDPDLEVLGENGAIRPHAEIADIGRRLEAQVAALPPGEQVQDGRTFVTRAHLREAAEKIISNRNLSPEGKQKRIKDLYNKHWFVTIEDIKGAFVHESARRVAKMLKTAKKYMGANGKTAASPAEVPSTEQPAPTPAKSGQPTPPNTASSSDKVTTPNQGGGGDSKNEYDLTGKMF